MRRILTLFGLLLVVCVGANAVSAVTINNGNSSAEFADTDAMMSYWSVDGTNHLWNQQWFVRVGTDDTSDLFTALGTPVREIEVDSLSYEYEGRGLEIEAEYSLTGGAPGSLRSRLNEKLSITNNGLSSVHLDLFQYTDWDLTGSSDDDNVSLELGPLNSATAYQWDSLTYAKETVNQLPTHYQTASSFVILDELYSSSDLTDDTSFTGPTDCTFAWQWSLDLDPGDSFSLCKEKSIAPVPEASTVLALPIGATALLGYFRRRRYS